MPYARRPAASQKRRLTGLRCECVAGGNWALFIEIPGSRKKREKNNQNEVLSYDGSINGRQYVLLIQTGRYLTFTHSWKEIFENSAPSGLCDGGDDGAGGIYMSATWAERRTNQVSELSERSQQRCDHQRGTSGIRSDQASCTMLPKKHIKHTLALFWCNRKHGTRWK